MSSLNDLLWELYTAWFSFPKSSASFSSVQSLSCARPHDLMDRSMPGFPVHHQLPELTQTHVHRVSDAIQPSHPLFHPSDKMWSTREGNGKQLQYSCLENPMYSMKRQKDRTLKDELPRSIGAQYATGDQWRNNFRKDGETEPKQKQHPAVDVTGDESKVRCRKEKYCIGTWNVRSMNQG